MYSKDNKTAKNRHLDLILLFVISIAPMLSHAEQAHTLSVQVVQQGARVTLLNSGLDYYEGIELDRGQYHLLIEKAGYTPFVDWIEIRDQDVVKRVNLTEYIGTQEEKAWKSYADGLKHFYGKRASKNQQRAKRWLKNASDLGNQQASVALERICFGTALDASMEQEAMEQEAMEQEEMEQEAMEAQNTTEMGQLTVEADPPDARIRIMDIRDKYKDGIELEPGSYNLRVEKTGYRTYQKTIELKAGAMLVHVSLQPKQPTGTAHTESPVVPPPPAPAPRFDEKLLYQIAVASQTVGNLLGEQAIEKFGEREQDAKRQIGEGCIANSDEEAIHYGDASEIYDVALRNCLASGMILYNEKYPN